MIWDHHDPFYLYVGTDGGSLCCVDVRCSTPVFTEESAHTSALSSLALSPSVTGCLVSASTDHSVKLWDVRGHSAPQLIRQRHCKIGEIHCAAACPDEPLLFCVGGEFEMKLLNFHNDEIITEKFAVSNPDLADKTVATCNPSDNNASNLSTDHHNIGKKFRKSKTTGTVRGSSDSDSFNKFHKLERTDKKVSKKSKKSKIEAPQSGMEKVEASEKLGHMKRKRPKDVKANSN